MVHACGASVPAEQNPGVILGATLGTLAKAGRDKLTIFASPGISDLGAWLEQLIAESTGKEGHGIIPVDREQIGAPGVYGNDRVFAYLRLENAPDAKQDAAVAALESAGQPVVRIAVPEIYDLGQEFFRWEIATAVAGSVIGINAFNQPDVEASKIETRKLTDAYEKSGSLPPESPVLEDNGIKVFTDGKNAAALKQAAGNDATLVGYLRAHLNRLHAGDYFAVLGYIQRTKRTKHSCRRFDTPFATSGAWPPASDSGLASCIPRDRRTKAARIRASSCKSRATMPPISLFPDTNILLES